MKYVIILMLIFVVSCATSAKRLGHLTLGMTKDQVLDIMGDPDSFKANDDVQVFDYKLLENGGWSWGHYWVVMKDNKLVQYGRAGDFNSSMPTQKVILDMKSSNN